MYQVLSANGALLVSDGLVEKQDALRLYETMVRLNVMDKVFFDAQRQGRISFYMVRALLCSACSRAPNRTHCIRKNEFGAHRRARVRKAALWAVLLDSMRRMRFSRSTESKAY